MQQITILVRFNASEEQSLRFGAQVPNYGVGGTQFLSIQLALRLCEPKFGFHVNLVTNRAIGIEYAANLTLLSVNSFSQHVLHAPLDSLGVIIAPAQILAAMDKAAVSRIANRTIAHSHHINDARIASLEACHTFAAVACVSEYHYHSTLCRSPKLFLRNLVAPNWTESGSSEDRSRRRSDLEIVFLGALVPGKGFLSVAESWESIKRNLKSVRLHVVGGSATYGLPATHPILPTSQAFGDEILRYINLQDIYDGRVVFYGNLGEEKEAVIRGADVAVLRLDNVRESFCLAAYECISLGVPVVGRRPGALKEVMASFPELVSGTKRQLVTTLRKLATDASFRDSIVSRCFEFSDAVVRHNDDVLHRWSLTVQAVASGRQPLLSRPQLQANLLLHVYWERIRSHTHSFVHAARRMLGHTDRSSPR